MNYLQLVQKTVRKSGAKVEVPTTVVGQTGITEMFVEWVSDAWKNIQLERLGVAWRVDRDVSFPLVAGTYDYAIDSDYESINTRSVTCHLSNENETMVLFHPYDYYRTVVDRIDRADGKPQYFTISPENTLVFWPNPDDVYTIQYDGIREVQVFNYADNAGPGTSDVLTPTNLPVEYQDAIVWQAITNYALHFEDGSKLTEAQVQFKPYKKYFEERFMDIPTVDTTALYSRA
jgi:hypothetical protein